MEKFKTKKEAQEKFEEKGIEFPKYKSGANEGKIKGTLDSLTKIYSDAVAELEPKVEEEVVTPAPVVETEDKPEVVEAIEEVTEEVIEEESKEEVAEVEVKVTPVKPKFHRGQPKRFNPMSFTKF